MISSKPKLLYFTETLDGGVLTYLKDLTSNLVRNFDITLGYAPREFTPNDITSFFDNRVHLIEMPELKRSYNVNNILRAIKSMKRVAEQVKPDIIHLHSSFAGVYGRIAFNGRITPLFYTPHGYSFLMTNVSSRKHDFYYIVEKVLGKRNCTTISCGPSEQKAAEKISKNAIEVDNGINIYEINRINSKKSIRINYDVYTVGRITAQKNPKLFNQIALEMPELKFLWIGDGEDKNLLTAPNITISGWLDKAELLVKSNSANIFILTSDWEGLPISLIEAMYLEKVCLVHDIPGGRDIIEDGKNGYICKNKNEFINRLKKIQELIKTGIGQKAKKDVLMNHSMTIISKKYADIYNSVLEKKQKNDGSN